MKKKLSLFNLFLFLFVLKNVYIFAQEPSLGKRFYYSSESLENDLCVLNLINNNDSCDSDITKGPKHNHHCHCRPGEVGATGATGRNGSTGSVGSTGATGADGEQGIAGETGATGSDGLPGADGATGATGADGLPGTNGATGATGSDGLPGTNGATGATGAVGAQGAVGATGSTGAVGSTGSSGITGSTGALGPVGATGATGATGPVGRGRLIFSAFDMTKTNQNPDGSLGSVYSSSNFDIRAWRLLRSTSVQQDIVLMFPLPQDYDSSGTVNITFYLFTASNAGTGNTANIRIRSDSKSNSQELGPSYTSTNTTGNFTVAEPVSGTNLVNYILTTSLTTTGFAAGNWVIVVFNRLAPTGGATEYNKDIYLNNVVIDYSRLSI